MAYEPSYYNGWVILKRDDWDAMQTKRIGLALDNIAPTIGHTEQTMRWDNVQDVVEYADTFIQPYTILQEDR